MQQSRAFFRNRASYFSISCQKRSMLTRRKIDTGEHWPPSTTCLVSLALKRERVSGDEIQPHRWNDNCSAVIANVSLGFTFAPLRNRRSYRWRGESRVLGNHSFFFFIPIFARENGEKSMDDLKRDFKLIVALEKKEVGLEFFLGKFVKKWEMSDSMHQLVQRKKNIQFMPLNEKNCLFTDSINFNWVGELSFFVSVRNPWYMVGYIGFNFFLFFKDLVRKMHLTNLKPRGLIWN